MDLRTRTPSRRASWTSLHYFPGTIAVTTSTSWRAGASKKYLLGVRFGYATGTPYTDIVGEIVRRIYDPGLNAYGTRGGGRRTKFIGGTRNGARLPATQRLDLDVTRTYSRARHDDRAVSERRERVLREERVPLRVRLFRESADARGDLAVPSSSVGRCLDSLLESRRLR